MKGAQCSSVVGLLCSISSCIICACGLFLDLWWQSVTTESNKQHYGLFTAVRCKDYICHLHIENSSTEVNSSGADDDSSSPDWIVFVQAFSLMQFSMLIFAIILQFISLLNGSIYVLIVASGAIGVACAASVIDVLVLAAFYQKMTHAYSVSAHVENQVIYDTLSAGLCAISGTTGIPAFVSIVIYRTQERRQNVKKGQVV